MADDDDEMNEVMNDNFTCSIANTKERPWTLFAACISHQSVGHWLGNMAALWTFGCNTYRIIGTASFLMLYSCGGVAASLSHVAHNAFTGRTGPQLTKVETESLQHAMEYHRRYEGGFQLKKHVSISLLERYRTCDMPSLGASGSVTAVSAVCAALFPLDKVRIPNRVVSLPISIPIAVGLYVGSDLLGITYREEGDNVGHAAHLGGIIFGSFFVYRNWYRGVWATAGDLPIIYRVHRWLGMKGSSK